MLLAVCGLAGAGKTTAVDILERLGEGARVYVGSFVTAEAARRGMPSTPQSERNVREDLRAKGGMDALAHMALPTITGIIEAGRVALVDAIYCPEEYDLYRERLGDRVARIALETTRSNREQRLATRALRPINSEALASRDAFELTQLGLAGVIAAAEYRLANNGSLNDLEGTLQQLAGLLNT